jgi:hypothetical protein
MSADDLSRPGRDLIKRAMASSGEAAHVVLEAGHRRLSRGAAAYADSLRDTHPDATTHELATRVVKAHLLLARSEGATAGVVLSTAQVTSIVGSAGTLTIPANVMITAADLSTLVWIQLRMVLTIAALYGHDPTDKVRLREFMILQGAVKVAADSATKPLVEGSRRVSGRLIQRYLRGPALANIKSLHRAVGINFTRAALLRQLVFLNVPINIAVNDAATRLLARQARLYYETLPPTGSATSHQMPATTADT